MMDRSPVFEDPVSRALLQQLQAVAPSDAAIMLQGDAGTGKEATARHLHALSRRAHGPFLAVNCGAFSEEQIQHDMFGHAQGAFRGAFAARPGWFEQSLHGTLFLDEVGALSAPLQACLLGILTSGQVRRLGADQAIAVNTRLVVASSENLAHAVERGAFLAELYDRLGTEPLTLPPLRHRPADILPLARQFIAHYRRRMNYPEVTLDVQACGLLTTHAWPGNIRELENVIQQAMLHAEGGVIHAADLRLPRTTDSVLPPTPVTGENHSLILQLERALSQLCQSPPPDLFHVVERCLVRAAYAHSQGHQIKAAQLLGISRNVLRGRLIEYGDITAIK